MAITFTDDAITITDAECDMQKVLDACTDDSVAQPSGGVFIVTKSLFVGTSDESCKFTSKNEILVLKAPYLQVYKGSTLQLGTLQADGSTVDGSTLQMTDPEDIYGFGYGADTGDGRHTENAGDLLCYGSKVDAYCFWAWFGGSHQKVHLIDSYINGFGRIQGSSSIMRNLTFRNSHSKYGIISPKGSIEDFRDITVKTSGQEGEWRSSDTTHAVYANPKIAPAIRIVGGVYGGYDKLVYTEKAAEDSEPYVEFVDAVLLGGVDCTTNDEESTLMIKFTFNPVFYNDSGSVVEGASIQITDKNGDVAFKGDSDANGEIHTELTVRKRTGASNTVTEDLNPYVIAGSAEINDETITFDKTFTVKGPMVKAPFHVSSGSGSSSEGLTLDQLRSELSGLKDDVCECSEAARNSVEDKLNTANSGIRTMLIDNLKEINENEDILRTQSSKKRMRVFI